MDYYQPMRDQLIHDDMYPVDYRRDYFPKSNQGEPLKIPAKTPCKPTFVSKIEGNAVEEGARVFFEGIVSSQPQPVFTWYFDDEEVIPGQNGFEEAEIHHSRKMSTLILKYAREHHMGKYTLVAQNRLGHDICNCDLIVRKKQFPPVFWKRLLNVNVSSGARVVAEVEVGGWPLPEVTWFREEDGEEVVSKVHTENYNGFPNKYVPERRIEVRQIDQIRYCILFHRISETDSGIYICRAVNPLGEAVCDAEFIIEPGEGGSEDLYLPEKWKTGNRLTWKMEDDMRKKPFVGYNEPELTDDDIASMTKRVASTPLPRAMEYFASLPAYKPKPLKSYGFLPMNFSPESGLKGSEPRRGTRGGKPSWPSRFEPGEIKHHGYISDAVGRIRPIWSNPRMPHPVDPDSLCYKPVVPDYPRTNPDRGERSRTPDAPPVWESDATIAALYQMLSACAQRQIDTSGMPGEKKIPNKTTHQRQKNTNEQQQQQHRKQVVCSSTKSSPPQRGDSVRQRWEDTLNADAAGAQQDAQAFTKQFVSQMYGETKIMTEERTVEKHENGRSRVRDRAPEPPALPPKTKIMFSPSRDVYSPTRIEEVEDDEDKKYIPVKEKAKMIQEQQAIIEESSSSLTENKVSGETLKGGVRILPPSPVTVRKEHSAQHQQIEAASAEIHREFHKESAQMSSGSAKVVMSSSSMISSSSSSVKRDMPSLIPVLEDKYNVEENLEELANEQSGQQEEQMHQVSSYSHTSSNQQMTYSSTHSSSEGGMRIDQDGMRIDQDGMRITEDGISIADSAHSNRMEEEFEALVREEQRRREEEERKHVQFLIQEEQANGHDLSRDEEEHSVVSGGRCVDSVGSCVVANLGQSSQSPVATSEERVKYRTPPMSPFQPPFYRTPVDDPNKNRNPYFRLPGQKTKTSTDVWMSGGTRPNHEDEYDGDSEF